MKHIIIYLVILFSFINKTNGQKGLDLPIIEDFESNETWIWKPWKNRSNIISLTTKGSARFGKLGLNCKGDYVVRTDKQIGLPGQAISWWIRFQGKARANCGFGLNSSGQGFFLCVDPSTNTLHFANTPDYTNPLLKVVSQTYKLNVWYRAEVIFNTITNVTGKLYSANGTTLLNSITLEIPDLTLGGLAIRGDFSVHFDDIRGGTREILVISDTNFAPKLGERLILKNIIFEVNKSNLLPQSFIELDRLVAYLKSNITLKIDIIGHTDNMGNEVQNKKLSTERAKAVAAYLIQKGINRNKVTYSGLGSLKPINTNATEEGKQKNRRVEFVIKNDIKQKTL